MGEHADDAINRTFDIEEAQYRHHQAWHDGLAEEPPFEEPMTRTTRSKHARRHLPLANELMEKLKDLEPRIHAKAQTGSIYIKFADSRIGALRIGDHPGKPRLRYRWSLRTDINLPTTHSHPHNQYHYPAHMLDQLCAHIRNYKRTIDERN